MSEAARLMESFKTVGGTVYGFRECRNGELHVFEGKKLADSCTTDKKIDLQQGDQEENLSFR